MRLLLFGATGMVGQGVLREALLDPTVTAVLSVGRSPLTTIADLGAPAKHPKLHELLVPDLANLAAVEPELTGYDACCFTLGVSSAGMREPDYRRLTYDLTLSVATALARLNPQMTFLYISGQGTDSSEHGRTMWARIKGATENALLRLPFRAAYMLRPGFIQPLHSIRSRTRLYQALYTALAPVTPLLRRLLPHSITTTEHLGRAMLRVGREGYGRPVLETADIASL